MNPRFGRTLNELTAIYIYILEREDLQQALYS